MQERKRTRREMRARKWAIEFAQVTCQTSFHWYIFLPSLQVQQILSSTLLKFSLSQSICRTQKHEPNLTFVRSSLRRPQTITSSLSLRSSNLFQLSTRCGLNFKLSFLPCPLSRELLRSACPTSRVSTSDPRFAQGCRLRGQLSFLSFPSRFSWHPRVSGVRAGIERSRDDDECLGCSLRSRK